jgi:serine/threonine protein phosphatase PrpC
MTGSVEVTAFTHHGRVRESNEDSITVAGWVSDVAMTGLRRSRHSLDEPLLCAVADGMGGHAAGEVASRYTVKRLASEIFAGDAMPSLEAALAAINSELYAATAADIAYRGMGTTVVGVLISASQIVWFNVGDSRLYRCRAAAVEQMSVDDVPPGARSGVITQSLGGGLAFARVEPHLGAAALESPSRWLLCSDGLTDMLSDADIAECLALDDEAAAGKLFERAMAAGGEDNFSIILISVGG